jgi:hypothetical protein
MLKEKLLKAQENYNKQVNPRESAIKTLKFTTSDSIKIRHKTEVFHRAALDKFEVKKAKCHVIIVKMHEYIDILHSKLERKGINNDQFIVESEESDESDESDEYFIRQEQYESDTQFDDDDDDDDYADNPFQRQPSAYYYRNMNNKQLKSDVEKMTRDNRNGSSQAETSGSSTSSSIELRRNEHRTFGLANQQESKCCYTIEISDELTGPDQMDIQDIEPTNMNDDDEKTLEASSTSEIESESSVLEADIPIVMIEAEESKIIYQSVLTEPDSIDIPVKCENDGKKFQQARLSSNNEAENSALVADKPVVANSHHSSIEDTHQLESTEPMKTDIPVCEQTCESEDENSQQPALPFKTRAESLGMEVNALVELQAVEPQIIKLNPLVNPVTEVKLEAKKPKRKQQRKQKKLKPKKFKTIKTFGRI